jgi:Domain of unknown function (DUF4157)
MNWRSLPQKTNSSFTPSQAGLLQRKCNSCFQHSISGRKCINCQPKSSLQRKTTIGTSKDPLELEADRIADQVLAAPANTSISTAPSRIQRFTGQTANQTDVAPASVDQVLSSPGNPLEPALQQEMGQRFGHDFSQVRVHTGGEAARSAQDVNAKAYATGYNIVFGAGQFTPSTLQGRKLLAHELTHVVQQSNSNKIRSEQSNAKSEISPIAIQRTPATAESRHGSTLPYKEANNLNDCMRIMGSANVKYCRREVLGENVSEISDEEKKALFFDRLRSLSPSNDPALRAEMESQFPLNTDDRWLAETILKSGPEPLWSLADITERQRRAMTNSWAPEPGNIKAVLGTGNHTVEAFYFRGTTDRRALVIGGVHGSEPGGVEVVNDLLTIMRSPNAPMPFFSVIVVPKLFSANIQAGRRASGGMVKSNAKTGSESSPDPNRQFPAIGSDPASNAALGCIVDDQKRCIEPENLVLLDLVNRFQPERVASAHGSTGTSGNVAQLLTGGGPSITTDPRPGQEPVDDALTLSMATEAKKLGVRIPGNFMGEKNQTTRYPTKTAAKMSPGVTFGQWGSHATPTRPAMNIILIETFGNTTSTSPSLNAVQQAARKTELMNLAQILRDFFLTSP